MTKLRAIVTTLFVALPLTLGAAGCTVGPDFHPPATVVSKKWLTPLSAGDVDADWWEKLDDPQLTQLVVGAIAGNKDLAEANARLREARANRDAAAGTSTPELGLVAAASNSRLSKNGLLPVGKVPGLGPNLSLYNAGFDASWEIDLWDGTKRTIEAAEARAQSAEEARRTVIMQVIAEVARSYIDLRAAQSLEKNAIAQTDAQQGIARIAGDRLRAGLGSRLDLVRSQAQASSTAASIPGFDADAAAAAFRIALLEGQPPEELYHRLREPGPLPRIDTVVSAGLRSDLLRRRPDIRQAESDLAAATADVGVATAELFPHVTLLGGLTAQARAPGDLVSTGSLGFSIGPSLHWPIFGRERIKARIRAADARKDAAVARYEKTVLTALADSEAAINRYVSARQTCADREQALTAAQQAVELAKRRYSAGEDDLDVLLQAQASLGEIERLSIQARQADLQQLVALYKALGGGWQVFVVPPVAKSAAISSPGPVLEPRA
jgi:NodT family efflux transporter outer membrane factor (OMF) lipoprotein